MADKKVITGSNIYSYKITPDGFEIAQANGQNKFLQKIPVDNKTEDEWKLETVRLAAAEDKTYKLNLSLLEAARIQAKMKIRDLFERSMYIPLKDDDTNSYWDATDLSAIQLVISQFILQDSGMPLEFNDVYNKSHVFEKPKANKEGHPAILPIIKKIGLSLMPKVKAKNELYAKLHEMYDIDEILKLNPYSKFGLTDEQATSINAVKTYF